MSDSNPPASAARPRRQIVLLAVLVVVLAAVIYMVWPAAAPAPASNTTRAQRKQAQATSPGSLDVRLEELKQPPTEPEQAARNPFRFYVKPPPPPPPPPKVLQPGEKGYVAPPPPPRVPKLGDPDYRPPPPPPIPLKFIGVLEVRGKKVAIFSDSSGSNKPPIYAAEGETVLGQYKLVQIGVESVTMEYLDGRGRQVIPMRG